MSASRDRITLATVKEAARVLRCIGHPVRLRIIEMLDGQGERTVTDVGTALGLEQAATSQHLTLMRDKGILASRRDGVNVYYRILDDKVTRVIDCLRSCDMERRGRRAKAGRS